MGGTSDLYSILPPGTRYRELWLPELINNHATLPSSIAGGHPLTLTGARKGSTADGVHFIAGVATSNIKFADPYDTATDWWCSFRFKLDQDFAAGAVADQYLFGKYQLATRYLMVRLEASDGKLYVSLNTLSGDESCTSVETSWEAGVWYHALVSVSTTNGQRVIVNGGTPQTCPAALTQLGSNVDMCIGARDDGVSTEGFAGVIVDVVMGDDTLSTTEEANLYKGIPPNDAVNFFPLDEGRGTTAYDRGSGADNGTLDTSCTWAFGQVQQPVLSLDGINDRTTSSAGVDISGTISLIAVVKAKSTYDSLAASHELVRIRVDDNNLIQLHYYQTDDSIRIYAIGAGAAGDVDYTTKPTIDDYLIFIATLTLAGTLCLYVNGAYIGVDTGVGAISGLAAIADIGSIHTGGEYDVSKPLLVGLVSGALPSQEAREVSRRIDSRFDLGVAI